MTIRKINSSGKSIYVLDFEASKLSEPSQEKLKLILAHQETASSSTPDVLIVDDKADVPDGMFAYQISDHTLEMVFDAEEHYRYLAEKDEHILVEFAIFAISRSMVIPSDTLLVPHHGLNQLCGDETHRSYTDDKKITLPPGTYLQRIVKCVCSYKAYQQVFEPIIADLQAEYFQALLNGAPEWQLKLIHIRYVIFFLQTCLGKCLDLVKWV